MVKFAAREEMVGLEVGTTGRPTAGRGPATSSREGAVAAGPGSDGKGLGVDRLAGGPCRKMVRQCVRRSGLAGQLSGLGLSLPLSGRRPTGPAEPSGQYEHIVRAGLTWLTDLAGRGVCGPRRYRTAARPWPVITHWRNIRAGKSAGTVPSSCHRADRPTA